MYNFQDKLEFIIYYKLVNKRRIFNFILFAKALCMYLPQHTKELRNNGEIKNTILLLYNIYKSINPSYTVLQPRNK